MPPVSVEQWIPLSEVLDLPAMKVGQPRVLTQMSRLATTKVTWVHVCEQADMTDFVDPANLVLTSGVGIRSGADGWRRMIDDLGLRKAAAIVVELRVTIDTFPEDLVARADSLGLTVIVLDRPARFVDITQGVHRVIAERQMQELQRTAAVHETFTRLTVTGAHSQEIVSAVAELTNASVVLEDLGHRVVAFATEESSSDFLARWVETIRSPSTTEAVNDLALTVGASGVSWGRLIMRLPHPATAYETMVADRAVAAIAFARSRDTGRQILDQDAQMRLMRDVLSPGFGAVDISARLTAYGLQIVGRALYACVIVLPLGSDHDDFESRASRLISDALSDAGVQGISATVHRGQHHILLSTEPSRADQDVLGDIASALRLRIMPSAIAFSEAVRDARDLPTAFEQSEHALAESLFRPQLPYVQPSDLSARGLLWLLRADPRLQAYVERQLGAILRLPRADRDRLRETLSIYLSSGRNIAGASRALHISRPALYSRLRRISSLTGAVLDDPDTAISLELALAALEAAEVPA